MLESGEGVLGGEVLVDGELAKEVEGCQIASGVVLGGKMLEVGAKEVGGKNVDFVKRLVGVSSLDKIKIFANIDKVVANSGVGIVFGREPGAEGGGKVGGHVSSRAK